MERAIIRLQTLARPATGVRARLHLLPLLRLWRQRLRTRRQLAQLDARQLADIGISRSERSAELDKPFWR